MKTPPTPLLPSILRVPCLIRFLQPAPNQLFMQNPLLVFNTVGYQAGDAGKDGLIILGPTGPLLCQLRELLMHEAEWCESMTLATAASPWHRVGFHALHGQLKYGPLGLLEWIKPKINGSKV